MFTITADWLDTYKTPRGGYVYQQVQAIGMEWPLISGWKIRAAGKQISEEQRKVFEAGALGKSQAKMAAQNLLGVPAKRTHAERRAQRELDRKIRIADAKASRKNAAKEANRIAKNIKREKVVVSGVSVTSDDFLQTFEWRRVRMMALKKYGPVCMCCGATPAIGAVMNVDHIKPRKLFPQLALDLDNLQVLCGPCNHGKGNWDITDWRPAEQYEDSPELIRMVRDIGAS